MVDAISVRLASTADADTVEVRSLLALAISTGRVGGTVADCIANGIVLLAIVEGRVVGCLCLSSGGLTGEWRIEAIAVDSGWRHHGIGRRLIREATAHARAGAVVAETDSDGVGFYARCGFATISLGEKYPGVQRFWCHWSV